MSGTLDRPPPWDSRAGPFTMATMALLCAFGFVAGLSCVRLRRDKLLADGAEPGSGAG